MSPLAHPLCAQCAPIPSPALPPLHVLPCDFGVLGMCLTLPVRTLRFVPAASRAFTSCGSSLTLRFRFAAILQMVESSVGWARPLDGPALRRRYADPNAQDEPSVPPSVAVHAHAFWAPRVGRARRQPVRPVCPPVWQCTPRPAPHAPPCHLCPPAWGEPARPPPKRPPPAHLRSCCHPRSAIRVIAIAFAIRARSRDPCSPGRRAGPNAVWPRFGAVRV